MSRQLSVTNPNGHLHSALKSLSYRIFGSVATTCISYLITGSAVTSLSIGMADFLTKFVLFYIHERLWVRLGRKAMARDSAERY